MCQPCLVRDVELAPRLAHDVVGDLILGHGGDRNGALWVLEHEEHGVGCLRDAQKLVRAYARRGGRVTQ